MSDKAIESIRAINLSELPEPFQMNAYTIVTNLELFVNATVCAYENARSVFDKEIQFEHLQEFYNAVKDYKKNPDKYIVPKDKIVAKIQEEKVVKPKPEKEKKKPVPKISTPTKPTEQIKGKGKGMSSLF